MRIEPNNGLSARVLDVDLRNPLSEADFQTMLAALGRHGVLHIPGQDIDADMLSELGARFGTLEENVANSFHAPGHPEVMILSNKRNAEGKPVGLGDAGQGWHTDMSYSADIALANILHAKEVPVRDGRALGETQFLDMHAAARNLPPEIAAQARVTGRVVQLATQDSHDIERHLAALREAGVDVQDIEIRRADLEDVFLRVMAAATAQDTP